MHGLACFHRSNNTWNVDDELNGAHKWASRASDMIWWGTHSLTLHTHTHTHQRPNKKKKSRRIFGPHRAHRVPGKDVTFFLFFCIPRVSLAIWTRIECLMVNMKSTRTYAHHFILRFFFLLFSFFLSAWLRSAALFCCAVDNFIAPEKVSSLIANKKICLPHFDCSMCVRLYIYIFIFAWKIYHVIRLIHRVAPDNISDWIVENF